MARLDPFFDKQPPLTFVDELRKPLYQTKPQSFGKRDIAPNEVDARGIFIETKCFDPLLKTSWDSFNYFAKVYEIGGNKYPIRVNLSKTDRYEAWAVEICEDGINIFGDVEGIRRALIWLEDEIRRSDAPFLRAGKTEKYAVIRSRITRCFFSPINRPPKYGDELTDDIDYYPEEYLNRLMHDGANGIWIYSRFSDLLDSEYMPHWGKDKDKRVAKLNRVIEKCAKYGIGVYLFAVEPIAMPSDYFSKYPEIGGATFMEPFEKRGLTQKSAVCVENETSKKFIFEAGKNLLEAAPNLKGFISITYGERVTACSSLEKRKCPKPGGCPANCEGKLLADSVEALWSGMRAQKSDLEFISWTYGHRAWGFDDIKDYVDFAPADVMLMQNFDDMGYEEQLGVMRQCVDYWLSYVGPSEFFEITAKQAKKRGKHIYAKMQVCCSHEMASVPYIPVPGILYEKYKGARELGVEGILQCWYFGNYPSMMSKAAGELSFIEKFSSKEEFLKELAAIYFGRTNVEKVVKAWQYFEAAYKNYPMNVMFSYYGPMHDSVVWKLWLEPKNYKLPRTWQTTDPIDGDRIGECLLQGHTLEEALILTTEICKKWQKGLELFNQLEADSNAAIEQLSIAKAIGLLWESGRNILEFYKLRDDLGRGKSDAQKLLYRMEEIVKDEINNSLKMVPLCENDGRLGYHSEGEGYKFFPEKLLDRVEQLKLLLNTEFLNVQKRIEKGLPPLEYYLGNANEGYELPEDIKQAPWQNIGDNARFKAAINDMVLTLDLVSDNGARFIISPEYELFIPNTVVVIGANGSVTFGSKLEANLYNSLFGDGLEKELNKYKNLTPIDGGLRVKINLRDFGIAKLRPFKMRIEANGISWINNDDVPLKTLGLRYVHQNQYGWMLPKGKI